MEKLRIAVLFGGCSPEHEVSLESAHAVLTHLDPARYEAIPVGITREGRWLLYRGPYDALPGDRWQAGDCLPAVLSPDRQTHGLLLLGEGPARPLRVDAAFPVLHGANGEDGTVQGLLALAGIPVVGCGVLSSALCMDKELSRRLAAAEGIPVAPWALFRAGEDSAPFQEACASLAWPRFVKPARAGSSFGVSRVTEPAGLLPALREAIAYDDKVLVEEAVPGREVGCAVLGRGGDLFTGHPDEIELQGGFFDYTEKYHLVTSRIHTPARVEPGVEAAIQALARRVYHLLDCQGMARVDLFLRPEGTLVFHEVNTIPGFTAHSRYPAMMAAAGLPLPALLDRLIGEAVGL